MEVEIYVHNVEMDFILMELIHVYLLLIIVIKLHKMDLVQNVLMDIFYKMESVINLILIVLLIMQLRLYVVLVMMVTILAINSLVNLCQTTVLLQILSEFV